MFQCDDSDWPIVHVRLGGKQSSKTKTNLKKDGARRNADLEVLGKLCMRRERFLIVVEATLGALINLDKEAEFKRCSQWFKKHLVPRDHSVPNVLVTSPLIYKKASTLLNANQSKKLDLHWCFDPKKMPAKLAQYKAQWYAQKKQQCLVRLQQQPCLDTKMHVACVCIGHGNLTSALFDGASTAFTLTEYAKVPLQNITVYTDSAKNAAIIQKRYESLCKQRKAVHGKLQIKVPQNKATLFVELQDLARHNKVLLTWSSHGYSGARVGDNKEEKDGRDEYVHFRGQRIVDDEFSRMFKAFDKSSTDVLVLVDTCASGTMMDLPYSFNADAGFAFECKERYVNPKKIARARIMAISACADSQSSMDNVANKTGYGGGLTCAFLDAVSTNSSSSLAHIVRHIVSCLSSGKQQATFTFNRL